MANSRHDSARDVWSFICPICGIYRITDEFLQALPEPDAKFGELLYRLSYQFRQASERISRPIDVPVHHDHEVSILLAAPDPSVEKKLNTLLTHLGRASAFPGEKVDFNYSKDYPLICAKNKEEVLFFLGALESQKYISTRKYASNYDDIACTLSPQGWLALEALREAGADSSQAFVAMWFDPSRSSYDQAIADAIRSSGYDSLRIDRVEHVNRIDDEIIARIRRSKFLVADFTGQRNGVYFEAGFMLGLGRPVIWVCQKDHLKDVHFDTRQYNTIDYTDVEDLRHRLQVRIEAIMGRGPIR